MLQTHIRDILVPPHILPPVPTKTAQQRVNVGHQRVIDDRPIITIPRITDAPEIMESRNPTAKCQIKTTLLIHKQHMQRNIPGGVLWIQHMTSQHIIKPTAVPTMVSTSRPNKVPATKSQCRTVGISTRTRSHVQIAQSCVDTKHAKVFTPHPQSIWIDPFIHPHPHLNLEHYANPMVHPITGKTISSYKKLMHNPATAKTWQTAFCKDFGGMAQGDNKTGQKGTNAMFVMTHDEIAHAYRENKFFT